MSSCGQPVDFSLVLNFLSGNPRNSLYFFNWIAKQAGVSSFLLQLWNCQLLSASWAHFLIWFVSYRSRNTAQHLVPRFKCVIQKMVGSRKIKFLADLWETRSWGDRMNVDYSGHIEKSLFRPNQLANILGLIKFLCNSSEFNFGSICQSHNHISQEYHLTTGQIHYHKHSGCSWIAFRTTADVLMHWASQIPRSTRKTKINSIIPDNFIEN